MWCAASPPSLPVYCMERSDGARSDAASSFAQMKDQAKLLRSASLECASRSRAAAGHRIN